MVESVQLTGPVIRRDGDVGNQLVVDINPKVFQKIGPRGVPMGDPGHCALVNPLISDDSASKIQNPFAKAFVLGSTSVLHVLDKGFNWAYSGVGTVDKMIVTEGLDQMTGLAKVKSPLLQSTAQWTERAGLVSALAIAYNYLSPRALTAMGRNTPPTTLGAALRSTGALWQRTWPLATAIFLTATGIVSDARKGLDAIDPDGSIFKGEDRKHARWASYAILFAGAALALNFPATKGYRKIVSPAKPPTGAHPMVWWGGILAAGAYFVWNGYWTNASIQERVLTSPFYNEPEGTGLYKPWKWQPEFMQGQTVAGHAIYWGLIGAAWAGLLSWQTRVTNKISTTLFGFGSEVLAVAPGSREQAFIAAGANRVTQALRTVGVRLFTPKRAAFTGLSALAGLPMGVGLGQMMEKAANYSSTTSTSGTPFRALITGPLAAVGMTFNTAAYGYATSWGAYAFNMVPVNYTWAACSQMGENLFQSARVMADDYQSTTDPNEKRRLRTLLFQLYAIAYDNGNTDVRQNEKTKIGTLLQGVGIRPTDIAASLSAQATEQYATATIGD